MSNDKAPTLTEFLLARIAEREAVARDAGGGEWVVECPYSGGNTRADPADVVRHLAGMSHADESSVVDADGEIVVYDEGRPSPEEAAHIARHSPARVLAECAAMRDAIRCAWDAHCSIEGEWGSGQSEKQMSANDDNPGVVRFLALPYADHPDFRQEWRP